MNKALDPAILAPPSPRPAPAGGRGRDAVGVDAPHESAHLHVAGAAPYVDDLPELAGTLHAALGLAGVAHGTILAIDRDRIAAMPGVVAVLLAADIPGENDCGPVLHDDPILADGTVHHAGQPVFAVIATTRLAAREAAARACEVLRIEPLPALLTAREAHAAGSHVLPPMRLARGDARAAIDAAPHRLAGAFEVGGQEQFYLEGQVSYAVPREDRTVLVHCSTQHPSEMQHLVAKCLGLASHSVQVECRRMGGGFGGKESQSALFACVAAVAAAKLGRPVKLRLDRDDDFHITGRRHDFSYDWEAGFDGDGRILGLSATLVSRAGFSADLSGPVMTRALCHLDGAYFLPAVDAEGHSARTHTASNTAFRGFGGPQGALLAERVVDEIARALGRDALDVRRANLYDHPSVSDRCVTPYGQPVDDCIAADLVAELARTSGYRERRAAIETFNAASPILKRGLALTPVKFGISFNLVHLNQAGALVHVYGDGSVLANHGGTEMGQGLHTKIAQVVAQALGVPLAAVRVTATDTQKIANTSATAASTGSDLNGKAAEDAALQIRARLATFAAERWSVEAEAVRFEAGRVSVGDVADLSFRELVALAYMARVQLWSDGFYATPGLSWDKETMTGRPFFYFAYGAAVSEVVVDTLTGEWKLLAAHVLHDAGRSLNPALDIGQVEGGFVQGMGWLTSEELIWNPAGRLLTHAPSTYKIPTANDLPADWVVRLWEGDNRADTIHRSKAAGEPPLLLPFSVFFAIRDAVSAVGGHRVQPPLDAPATPEAILMAIEAVRAR